MKSASALPIRPGEHACGRFARAVDGEQIVAAFVRDGLTREHKVLFLRDGDDVPAFTAQIAGWDPRIEPALESGQIEVRPAREAYMPDGEFQPERMLELIGEEEVGARAAGYAALSATGEMTWALDAGVDSDALLEYERRLDEVTEPDTLMLCQFDQTRFGDAASAEIAAAHEVDISPALALIGAAGHISGAHIHHKLLRLAGTLDFTAADVVSLVLDSNFDGDLRLDLADLDFIDVAGLRSLRGERSRALSIDAASQPVRRLLDLLGWDDAPAIRVAAAS
jgi:anti-anti-sigma regulatory factor